jgi:hypothetical protein
MEVMQSEHALHALDGGEEVCSCGRGEVGEAAVRAQRADEDVAGEEGLEVDDGEGVGGCEEDLVVWLVFVLYIGCE